MLQNSCTISNWCIVSEGRNSSAKGHTDSWREMTVQEKMQSLDEQTWIYRTCVTFDMNHCLFSEEACYGYKNLLSSTGFDTKFQNKKYSSCLQKFCVIIQTVECVRRVQIFEVPLYLDWRPFYPGRKNFITSGTVRGIISLRKLREFGRLGLIHFCFIYFLKK